MISKSYGQISQMAHGKFSTTFHCKATCYSLISDAMAAATRSRNKDKIHMLPPKRTFGRSESNRRHKVELPAAASRVGRRSSVLPTTAASSGSRSSVLPASIAARSSSSVRLSISLVNLGRLLAALVGVTILSALSADNPTPVSGLRALTRLVSNFVALEGKSVAWSTIGIRRLTVAALHLALALAVTLVVA